MLMRNCGIKTGDNICYLIEQSVKHFVGEAMLATYPLRVIDAWTVKNSEKINCARGFSHAQMYYRT
mgnify:FL=1